MPVAESRYMPVYANSVKIQLYEQKKVDASLANDTINRPAAAPWTTTIKLKDALPPGNYQLIATGYLQPNAAGDIVSTATVNFTLTQSEQEVINISQQMNTAIDHITIADTPITLQKNASQGLNYTVFNSDNVALMLPTNTFSWSITSGNSLATITNAGHLTTTGAGTITVRISEDSAGKYAETTITILEPAQLRIFSTAVEYSGYPLNISIGSLSINGVMPYVYSAYYEVPAGLQNITSYPNQLISLGGSIDYTFVSNTKYTFFAQRTGEPVVVENTSIPPGAGKAKVRFINTHWLNDNFEFFLYETGGAPGQLTSKAFATSAFVPGDYIEIAPGTYTFDVSTPSGYTSAAYQTKQVTLNDGDIYTMVVSIGWSPNAPNGTAVLFALKEN